MAMRAKQRPMDISPIVDIDTLPGEAVVILWMGHLVHFADRRASRLEAIVPGIIDRALIVCVTPFSVSIDALTTWILVCKRGHGAIDEVMTLKAAFAELRNDMDQLKSTYRYMIFGTVEIPDMPSYIDVPPANTEYEVRVEEIVVAEFEAETNEE
ncbi:uncharacterized protein LOC125823206 [Solanum verrucosum]|uniref:uncharacterized protein LOC125823206 n=1 Tax=Solanum verrucosum TaxID=315347 RepID=UPI0020D0B4DF|nr:uncharacterized protein LOC125823206 [Solanum verrucosum]